MLRFAVFSVISFAIIISCMGQMFQYSRGWTNGKRSPSNLHQEPIITEVYEVPTESDRRLERCMYQLQHLINNPYLLRPSFGTGISGNGGSGIYRHQSNEFLEDLTPSSESGEFSSIKHN